MLASLLFCSILALVPLYIGASIYRYSTKVHKGKKDTVRAKVTKDNGDGSYEVMYMYDGSIYYYTINCSFPIKDYVQVNICSEFPNRVGSVYEEDYTVGVQNVRYSVGVMAAGLVVVMNTLVQPLLTSAAFNQIQVVLIVLVYLGLITFMRWLAESLVYWKREKAIRERRGNAIIKTIKATVLRYDSNIATVRYQWYDTIVVNNVRISRNMQVGETISLEIKDDDRCIVDYIGEKWNIKQAVVMGILGTIMLWLWLVLIFISGEGAQLL